ncbi:hypothetical protein B0H17DRAFT_1274586 [Mycena rosella]|uniref:Uncharacterized protein n=1 Tax=Mycena rosella TaxID=1033263 RepID=A0AAD7CD85_MYCRO|nr:hypothetical protein B0H17DRAFT_1274586 [Mycena rosella]
MCQREGRPENDAQRGDPDYSLPNAYRAAGGGADARSGGVVRGRRMRKRVAWIHLMAPTPRFRTSASMNIWVKGVRRTAALDAEWTAGGGWTIRIGKRRVDIIQLSVPRGYGQKRVRNRAGAPPRGRQTWDAVRNVRTGEDPDFLAEMMVGGSKRAAECARTAQDKAGPKANGVVNSEEVWVPVYMNRHQQERRDAKGGHSQGTVDIFQQRDSCASVFGLEGICTDKRGDMGVGLAGRVEIVARRIV